MAFRIDEKKLKRDLEREVKSRGNEILTSITTTEKLDVGLEVVDEMKKAIAKGISPIEGKGRFPAYKWAGKKNAESKGKRAAKKREIQKQYANKYPFNMKNKFPNKKERPVNLNLSGDFLNSLIAVVFGPRLYIGFYDAEQELKEEGHRMGFNGQPKRPIIPTKGEKLSSSIYRRLVQSLTVLLKRKK